ncbi:MAG TPA: DUF3500 domain-containing protein [Gemmataceae bacterium]|jgi:hypothetical protein|nr:DUF3500 domain-containing protein [Gemmataceae bacterium]
MKLVRLILAIGAVGGMTGLAYVAQQNEAAGPDQVSAASAFVDSLTPEQKQIGTFPFDSEERFDWNFTPQQDKNRKATRKGIPFEKLTAEQKAKAFALLKSGTSQSGDQTAKAIMNLENVLKEAEKMGAMVRTPEWYFVTIFGTPSKTGKWGWRFEGHHMSINTTLDGMQVVTETPFFFGANPAENPKTKMKVLGPAQELAAKLYDSLDADQKKAATADKDFPEPGEKTKNPKVGTPSGLAYSKMTADQKALIVRLLEYYTGRMPRDVGDREMKMVTDAGLDNVYFGYHGSTKDGEKRSYRMQGPTFVVEFLNVQTDGYGNPANHIHSAWRRIKGDFGLN